jgi:MYXO-CTERM domain-containing protein
VLREDNAPVPPASPAPWIALAALLVLGMGGAVLWRRRLT